MKRSLCLMLVLVCTAALVFFGCGRQGGAGGGGTTGKLPLRYYMPGGPSTEAEVVTAAINEALARDGVNIDFQPVYVPWDQWVNRTNLMLSTGEEFEMIHVMMDFIPLSTYTSRNQAAGLSALINREAPNLKARFDKPLWDSVTIDGEIYAIPAYWRDASGDAESFLVLRKDIFDKFELPYPKTTNEMLSVLPTLQQRWKAVDGITRYVYEHTLIRPPTVIHRTYDTWPFFVSQDGIFYVRQNGDVAMYFETPEFRKDAEFMNALYTRGLIHPDILNLPMDTWRTNTYDNGDFLACFMTGPYWTTAISATVPGAEIIKYDLDPNKPYLTTMPLLNANAIPLSAKHPEVAIKFLDWMYSSQANQDLVLHGIQGRHWTPVGSDGIRKERKADGSFVYNFDDWMIEYVKYHRFDADYPVPDIDKADHMGNIHSDNTVVSPVVGFSFDPERVRVEYANVQAEYTASIIPIKVGVIPYAANYQAALAKMKAAGSDAVIAEYRRQLAAFIASKR